MGIFTGALAETCNVCPRPGQWEKDDKEEKSTARQMIKMMLAINKENFNGRLEVSCATCHAGHAHPTSIPPLGQAAPQPRPRAGNAAKEPLPTIDQVLEKYLTALGGQTAVEKIKTRVIKSSRIGTDGSTASEEIYEKTPDKLVIVTAFPQGTMTNGYNGTSAWATNPKGESHALEGDEAEQFKREAQLLDPSKLKSIYKDIAVAGVDKMNDRDVYVLRAVTPQGGRERLYFDKQTGRLVRRFAATMTVLGVFPYQVDYSDYKSIDGVQVPMSVTGSTPGRTWTRKVIEVKQNAVIDEARFNQPAK